MKQLVVVVALVLGALPSPAADLAEAEAAFQAGEQARALALYDELLREQPDAVEALVHSGMLLSWDKRYDEAVARYDRALRLAPGHPQASLERAKVLSWSGRNDAAAEAFRSLLAKRRSDRDARLGLARSLSWGGRQVEARAEYAVLLEANPRDTEALVGTAQTHAWSGELAAARQLYQRALAVAPDQREAQLGLGYVDLWTGLAASADRTGARLEARFPGDAEVAEFRREVRNARRPRLTAAYERLVDTDDHSMDTVRLETGFGFRLFDLGLGAVRHDLHHPLEGDGTIEGIFGTVAFRPTWRQLVTARLGSERRETPGNDGRSTVGGLAWIWGIGGPWQVTAGWDRDPYRYSTAILANGVTVDTWRVRLDATPWESWRFSGGLARGELDATGPDAANTRDGFDAGAWYRRAFGRLTGEAGYAYRTLDYERDLDLGYFDPQDFRSHLVQVRGFGPFFRTPAYWDATVEAGYQSFTLGGVDTSGDQVLGGTALLGVHLNEAMALEATASRTDYALESATGFRSRTLGLRLRWRVGDGQ